jgi:SAM-dependent methyltransferase
MAIPIKKRPFFTLLVGVGGLEPPTSASQTQRASNCATPRRREYNAKYTHPSRRIRLFPALYHAHHRQYQDDLLFWLNLADRYRDPILELSCGTGRVLIPLARAGYRIFGLDNDPAMLAYLQANIEPNLKHRTRIFEGDLTRFHLTEQLSLILLPCNTYSTLDTTERKSTLQCVHAHLCGGGIFAVSVPNPLLLADLPPGDEAQVETVFEHPDSGLPVQVSSAWETTNDAVTFICLNSASPDLGKNLSKRILKNEFSRHRSFWRFRLFRFRIRFALSHPGCPKITYCAEVMRQRSGGMAPAYIIPRSPWFSRLIKIFRVHLPNLWITR